MKSLRLVVSPGRFLLNSLLLFSLVSPLVSAASGPCQSKIITRNIDSDSLTVIEGDWEIPKATEPCTPEECEWWERVRKAGHGLYKKSDKKSITRFHLLLYEGLQKEYRIPVKDSPPKVLVFRMPDPNRTSKIKITGSMVLSVEFRADASVGEILVQKKTGITRLDEQVIRVIRQQVFLPAIKNGAFVTSFVENREIKFTNWPI